MHTPDWDDLRYFLAVIDAGTLSGAARALGVEHSTVARRIDALEAPLAMRLFDRFPKGWSLTAAGGALQPHARRMEDDMHALMRAAAGAATVSGKVRISAPPALASCWLAPRLQPVLRRLSGVEIELLGEWREADLTRREADIALRFRRPTAPGLTVRLLHSIDYGLYASAGYLAERLPQDWEFLGYGASLGEAPQQQWLDKLRGTRRYCLRCNDQVSLYQAAVAGSGVTVLPTYFEQQGGPLVRLDTGGAPGPAGRKLWMVMHQDVRRAAHVRAVADELVVLFATDGKPAA